MSCGLPRSVLVVALAATAMSAVRGQGAAIDGTEPVPLATVQLERAVQAHAPPGFFGAVLVVRDGRVLLRRGYGRDPRSGARITPETLFDIGSVSKQFTAAAILQLADQGRLSTFDTLDEFFADVPEDKRAIRVHHLLHHTSGLTREPGLGEAEREDRDAMLAKVLAAPLEFAPGEAFAYNNTGYSVLAAIVEVAGKTSFERWVRRRLLTPAGMTGAGFTGDAGLDVGRAAARVEGAADADHRDTAVAWPWHWAFKGATGIVASVDDLHRWDRALARGEVLDTLRLEQMFRDRGHDYAYGLEVVDTGRGTTRMGHSGRCYGFRSRFARFPQEDALIVVLGNSVCDASAMAAALETVLFSLPPPAEIVAACVGRYRLGDADLEVVAVDGRLRVRAVGNEAACRLLHGRQAPAGDAVCRSAFAERARDRADDLLGSARQRGRVLSPSAPDGTDAAVVAVVEALRAAGGGSRGLRLIGSRSEPPRSWFRIRTTGEPACLVVTWDDEQRAVAIERCALSARSPFDVALSWRRGRVFAGRSLDGWEELSLEFAPGRTAPRLLWRDRSTGSSAPVVCRRR